jgi:hypothetical protein
VWTREPIPGTDLVRMTERCDLREMRSLLADIPTMTTADTRAMVADLTRQMRAAERAAGIRRRPRPDVLP